MDYNEIGVRSNSTAIDKYFNTASTGLNTTANILASFDISVNSTVQGNPCSPFIYNPQYEHWNDMFRDTPLYNIDLYFAVTDSIGNIFNYNIRPEDNFSVKLIFARKFF